MYVKSNYITNAYSRLKYLFDEPAHDGSAYRVLGVNGAYVYLWGPRGQPYPSQSGYFLSQQFKAVRQQANNPHKRQQAQHLICSFSEQEMPTNNLDNIYKEVKQINQLVGGFMAEYFPDTQWVSAIQDDGQEGHKLHCHILINSVLPDGKCVRTNNFSVHRLRHEWNDYLKKHYLEVTGHVYINPFAENQPGRVVKPKGWQASLKNVLQWARNQANTTDEYLKLLETKGVTVTTRNKKGDWSYHVIVNGKRKTVRDFYQRRDRKTGLVKRTRGMGQKFTPMELDNYFEHKLHSVKKEDSHNEQPKETKTKSKQIIESAKRKQRISVSIARQQAKQCDGNDEEFSNKAKSSGFCSRHYQSNQHEESGIQPGS